MSNLTSGQDCTMSNSLKIDIELEEIVSFLQENLQFKDIYWQILRQRIIQQVAQQRNITVTEEEILAEAERQRREKRLEKAADTFAWLADQMITDKEWEKGIYNTLLAKKVAESLFEQEVEKIFKENKLNFEQVVLYQIIIPYEKLAQEIFYQIEEEEISFYHAAHLYDIDEKRRAKCGYEGKIYRWSLNPDIAAVVFSSNPLEAIGPIKIEKNYHLLLVEEFIPAQLSLETRQEILDKMFNDWLSNEVNYFVHTA
jgi:parvulin-like peptidyl-prolyl isomerase